MAKKTTRGLPDTFTLNVPPKESFQQPVALPDYLDDEPPAPKTELFQPPRTELSTTSFPEPVSPKAPPPPRVPVEPASRMPRRPDVVLRRPARSLPERKLPTRKQLNMTPATLQMLDELLEHLRKYSVQRDAKASELMEGLVSALHEAKQHLDVSTVPSRGRWGSPNAKAFPVYLKMAFQGGIADYVRAEREAQADESPTV